MADKTVTVYHPTVLNPAGDVISYDVPADSADAWVEQGWVKSEPKNAAIKAAQKAAEAADPVPAE